MLEVGFERFVGDVEDLGDAAMTASVAKLRESLTTAAQNRSDLDPSIFAGRPIAAFDRAEAGSPTLLLAIGRLEASRRRKTVEERAIDFRMKPIFRGGIFYGGENHQVSTA